MKTKEIKNPDAPLGRNDWKGRQPRWRPSWQLSKFLILKESMEVMFDKYPERRTSFDYQNLYEEIVNITMQMQTPLMAEIEENSLF